MTFSDLNIDQDMVDALAAKGIIEPFPIQTQTIPLGLAKQDIIGQAKGVVMERFDLDAVEAFELLTRLSQQSNTKLIDIAKALIDGEHPLKRRNHTECGT